VRHVTAAASTAEVFRQRLLELIERSGMTRSRFAARARIDRSTLSQLLSPENERLPRVETLAAIARTAQVSIDWLVGLTQEGRVSADILQQQVEVTPHDPSPADDDLLRWHAEAAGYKVRYVPTTLPDVLKIDPVIEYEYGHFHTVDPEQNLERSQRKLANLRQRDSEMEVCNSVQAVEAFARGEGLWRDLAVEVRRQQLLHMISLCDELYPGFRWFFYDARHRYSVPLSIFGPSRAVIYVGQMYFVFNSLEHVRVLTRHFEDLVRAAVVQPNEVCAHLRKLLIGLETEVAA
jgi:transcriptional regulator with XRE-family HTH domain